MQEGLTKDDIKNLDVPQILAVASYVYHNSDGQIKQLTELIAGLCFCVMDLEAELEKLELLPERIKRIENKLKDGLTWE